MKTDHLDMLVSLRYETVSTINCFDEEHIQQIKGDIFAFVEPFANAEREVKLGKLELFRVQIGNAINDGESVFSVFDMHQLTLDIGTVLFDPSFEDFSPAVKEKFETGVPSEDILILDELSLDPAVRGQKLGLAVLDRVVRDWASGCSLVAVKPIPAQLNSGDADLRRTMGSAPEEPHNGHAEPYRRLRAYFERFGFKRIGHSGIYALSTHNTRPSLKDLSVPEEFTVPVEFVEKRFPESEKQ